MTEICRYYDCEVVMTTTPGRWQICAEEAENLFYLGMNFNAAVTEAQERDRKNRFTLFQQVRLPELLETGKIKSHKKEPGSYFRIETVNGVVMHYYPKADKVYYPDRKRWHENGLAEIRTELAAVPVRK